jgi:hypothetical protein
MNERPIACTLGAAELTTLAGRWSVVRKRAELRRNETTDGLRLDFRVGDGVEDELRALVAVESECCAWAEWSVERHGDELRVSLTADGEGIEAAHGMFR